MVKRQSDLTGIKFNFLTVIRMSQSEKYGYTTCVCLCDCGNIHTLSSSLLKYGITKSCGCLRREKRHRLTHGESINGKTNEYRAWDSMKERCLNIKSASYVKYGARGITVCDRWVHSYELFLEDMGRRPKGRYSLERLDVNGNYEPGNCVWATDITQQRNKRSNVTIEYNGLSMLQTDWAKKLGVSDAHICKNLKRGVAFSEIVCRILKRQRIKGNNLTV